MKTGKIQSNSRKIQINPDIIYTDLDKQETLVVNIRKQRYYVLNRLTWKICLLLAQGVSQKKIARHIGYAYHQSKPKQLGCIQTAIKYLKRLKLTTLS